MIRDLQTVQDIKAGSYTNASRSVKGPFAVIGEATKLRWPRKGDVFNVAVRRTRLYIVVPVMGNCTPHQVGVTKYGLQVIMLILTPN